MTLYHPSLARHVARHCHDTLRAGARRGRRYPRSRWHPHPPLPRCRRRRRRHRYRNPAQPPRLVPITLKHGPDLVHLEELIIEVRIKMLLAFFGANLALRLLDDDELLLAFSFGLIVAVRWGAPQVAAPCATFTSNGNWHHDTSSRR